MRFYNVYASCGNDAFVRKNMQKQEFLSTLEELMKLDKFNKFIVVRKNEIVL